MSSANPIRLSGSAANRAAHLSAAAHTVTHPDPMLATVDCPRCGSPIRPRQEAAEHMATRWVLPVHGEDGHCTDCEFMTGADAA